MLILVTYVSLFQNFMLIIQSLLKVMILLLDLIYLFICLFFFKHMAY